MACINCAKIRSAILHGKMAEALNISVEMLREKIGLKPDEVEDFHSWSMLETGASESTPPVDEVGAEAVIPKGKRR